MAKEKTDLLRGTLDLLILKAFQLAPMHGFGVSVRIRQFSAAVLQVDQDSLYPALYRLEELGKQLEQETANRQRVSLAINQVFGATIEQLP